jgi:altronate hydrolase
MSMSPSLPLHRLAEIAHVDDDVAVARQRIPAGCLINDNGAIFSALAEITAGHKLARRALASGEPVRRYGEIIGWATAPIAAGDHVHTHNLACGQREVAFEPSINARPVEPHPKEKMRFFEGFKRPDGRVGTRNCVLVLSTVNCSASVCQMVRERFRDIGREYPNVDGVFAVTHPGGCGSAARSEDHRILMRVLGGYARHPNTAASVIVGLGCEKNLASTLVADQGLQGIPCHAIQDLGGTGTTVDAVAAAVRLLLPRANACRRTREPVSELVLATKCGGSDGNSGITANPALGWAVDELIRHGGTAVLGETPEICGAEHLLIRRAADPEVARELIERVEWWQKWCGLFGVSLDANPSPGNIDAGITTLFEKSLGAILKGGTTPLRRVVRYAEPISSRGLVFMDTPGYDPVTVTGLIAGGATVVAFTTGCGSVFGSTLVPTIKLATTSDLFRRMRQDMDVDCGPILAGVPLGAVGASVLEKVIAVASGERTKSETLGIGEAEFLPWSLGPVL